MIAMSRRREDHSVAITGIGLVTPIGHDLETFRERLWSNRSGIGEIEHFDVRHSPTRAGGEVRNFRLETYAPHALCREIESLDDRRVSFGCAALIAAHENAGLAGVYPPDRIGLALGTGAIAYSRRELNNVLVRLRRSSLPRRFLDPIARDISPRRHQAEYTAERVGAALGIRGPRRTHVSTCAASAMAIGSGLQMLRRGTADACLVGGFDSLLTPGGIASFALLGVLSMGDRPPHQLQRPFDRHRDGMVIGEGAVVFVLEHLARARVRGARIFGELCGFGASMDGFHIVSPEPRGAGAARAIRRALDD
ncbi:MAG: hypothetical protein FJW90_12310, partial [Actinobacteria bacterium]|nr:hypothetical protein [Actinomycetota bacterium]